MTVKKAISHIDLLIQDKQDLKMKMIGPVLPLPIHGDTVNRFDRAMGSMLEKDIEWLQSIKRQLLPEQHMTKIVCRHLKKDHDIDPNGQKYCTGCNANL
jgi:hypothetical protein